MHNVVHASITVGLVFDGRFGIGVLSILQRVQLYKKHSIKHRESFTTDRQKHQM